MTSDTQQVTIDRDAYKRLTQGTEFQRSINVLTLIDNIGAEMALDFAKAAGLTGLAKKSFLKKLQKERLKGLRKNPPPGIDPGALEVFCK
jgi:hypothetical protein